MTMTVTATTPVHEPAKLLLGFARALRAAGVTVTADREAGWLEAASVVGLDNPRATYWAGRATLCSSPSDGERYDQVFNAWFYDRPANGRGTNTADPSARPSTRTLLEDGGSGQGSVVEQDELIRALASADDVLRHRDVGTLTPGEKARLATMFATLRRPSPRRRAARRVDWHRGELDRRRTLRGQLRGWGEPGRLEWRRRTTRPRRVVLLIDVSGSMGPYADALLRLAHRWAAGTHTGEVEVFTMGTRLTRVTAAMRLRDPERALVAAGETVPDWSGGTRLGESVKAFLDQWGQRGMARGAVVVVVSDGWERGGADLLGAQLARLRSLAHRVVWVNPHRGKLGYEPVQQGIVAALPHCDAFVAGHSLATFEELARVVDGLDRSSSPVGVSYA